MPEELTVIMEPANDVDLIPVLQDLKLGSEMAFNALYQMYSKVLLGNIQKLVKDHEVAKELLQDLYMRIWEKRENIDLDKPFKSFLFTIARNLVLDYLRRVAMDKKARVRLIQNVVESYSNTEDILDYKEANVLFMQAIERLPAQCKQVFVLSKLQHKSHQQISDEMGISLKTVNNYMTRANKGIKSYLLGHSDKAVLLFVAIALSNLK